MSSKPMGWPGPILTGKKVILKPFSENDITREYLAWLSNKELMKYSNQRFRSHTMETCMSYLNSFKGTNNFFYAIYHGERHVGTITSYVSLNHKTADIGLLVGEQSQGNGFGSDAWRTLMDYLFHMGIRKVTGGTLACNLAMVKIMTKSGMVSDGKRVGHELVNGLPEDILYFAKFNS